MQLARQMRQRWFARPSLHEGIRDGHSVSLSLYLLARIPLLIVIKIINCIMISHSIFSDCDIVNEARLPADSGLFRLEVYSFHR